MTEQLAAKVTDKEADTLILEAQHFFPDAEVDAKAMVDALIEEFNTHGQHNVFYTHDKTAIKGHRDYIMTVLKAEGIIKHCSIKTVQDAIKYDPNVGSKDAAHVCAQEFISEAYLQHI